VTKDIGNFSTMEKNFYTKTLDQDVTIIVPSCSKKTLSGIQGDIVERRIYKQNSAGDYSLFATINGNSKTEHKFNMKVRVCIYDASYDGYNGCEQ
jgi:hypothetical protein